MGAAETVGPLDRVPVAGVLGRFHLEHVVLGVQEIAAILGQMCTHLALRATEAAQTTGIVARRW